MQRINLFSEKEVSVIKNYSHVTHIGEYRTLDLYVIRTMNVFRCSNEWISSLLFSTQYQCKQSKLCIISLTDEQIHNVNGELVYTDRGDVLYLINCDYRKINDGLCLYIIL